MFGARSPTAPPCARPERSPNPPTPNCPTSRLPEKLDPTARGIKLELSIRHAMEPGSSPQSPPAPRSIGEPQAAPPRPAFRKRALKWLYWLAYRARSFVLTPLVAELAASAPPAGADGGGREPRPNSCSFRATCCASRRPRHAPARRLARRLPRGVEPADPDGGRTSRRAGAAIGRTGNQGPPADRLR